MSCTVAEWLALLPRAIGQHPWTQEVQSARVRLGTGQLCLRWQVLPPRTIGLIRLERLRASFQFEGLDAAARHAFMKRFDLYTQRGGG